MNRIGALVAAFSLVIAGEAAAYTDGPVVAAGNIPLARATARLVPRDATVSFLPDVDQAVFIRWGAGPSWQRSLFEALTAANIGVTFSASGVAIGGPVKPFEPYLPPMPVAQVVDGVALAAEAELPLAPLQVAAPSTLAPAATEPDHLPVPHGSAPEGGAPAPTANSPRSIVPSTRELQAGADSPSAAVPAQSTVATQPSQRGPDEVPAAPLPSPPAPAIFVPVLAAKPVPEQSPVPQVRWAVGAQSTLQATLQTWSESAGWTLYYETPTQYELPAPAELHGTFEEATSRLIHLLRNRRPVPLLSLHPANKSLAIRSFTSGGASR